MPKIINLWAVPVMSFSSAGFSPQALADPYFYGLAKVEREPSSPPASKTEFDFERKKLSKDDVRELIHREVCTIYKLELFVSKQGRIVLAIPLPLCVTGKVI